MRSQPEPGFLKQALLLEVVLATNSPHYHYDQSAIGQPRRVYQFYETNAP
jgi:hypothetical protein